MKGAVVMERIWTAQGGRDDVIDLPSILALRTVVGPEDQGPVSIDSIFGLREALDRATCRPSGELVLFRAGESDGDIIKQGNVRS